MSERSQRKHIFISYRRQEPDKAAANRLAADLRAAGHAVWMDVEGIEGAEDWTAEIQRAIDEAYAYVVILSPEALDSRWVRNELSYALRELPGRVFPLMFRKVRLPLELVRIQHINIEADYEAGLAQLLRDLPGEHAVTMTAGAAVAPPRRPTTPRIGRLWLWLAGAGAVLAVVAGVLALAIPALNNLAASDEPAGEVTIPDVVVTQAGGPSDTSADDGLVPTDTFDDGLPLTDTFEDLNSGFRMMSDGRGAVRYQSGELQMNLTGPEAYLIAPTERVNAADVQIEVDVDLVDALPGTFLGVECRSQYPLGNAYRFTVFASEESRYAVARFVDEQVTEMEAGDATEALNSVGDAVHHVTAICVGTEFSFSLNGTQLAAFTDDGLAEAGDVALFIGTTSFDGSALAYDNLTVSSP